MTMGLIDRYWLWSMNEFYEKLRDDLVGYGDHLAEALEKNEKKSIETYLRMIKETRQIIADIRDENMEVGDFARLVTSKYLGIPE